MKNGKFFPYDVGILKEVERRSHHQMIAASSLLFVMIMILAWIEGDAVIAIICLIYVGVALLWQLWLAFLPDKIGPGRLVLTSVFGLLHGLAFALGIWHLMNDGSYATSLIAMMGVMGAILYTVGIRAENTLATALDALGTAIMLAIIPTSLWYGGAEPARVGLVALMAVAACGFFFYTIWLLVGERRAVREAAQKDAQREKLRSLGHLTGGVAHDFNNLLTVIIGNLEIGREMGPGPDREALMAEVEEAAQSASHLTRQLLSFSRSAPLEPTILDVEKNLSEVRALLARLLPATHVLQTSKLGQVPQIRADRAMLQSVLINMVLNARDSMSEGGLIRVLADGVELTRRRTGTQPEDVENGLYARISICDTGTGIPEHIQSRLFEPYFTTKPPGKGSGFGLPMALSFAQQSGGTLTFETQEGKGTEIHLWFPAAR